MSANSSAVFLSYASQDAEAVERIATALRAAGVEVWFDRNELVGGDAWDRKIRQQIRECALFVPVISATTQARGEGYFRLEWKLAVDRSHLMAPDQPFLLPVVIDDTPDAAARVADEFRAVQWTRLRPVGYAGQARSEGEDPALEKFCTRVKQLLGGNAVLQPTLATEERGLKHRATPKPSRPWLVPAALIAVVALVVLAFWQPWKRTATPLSEARKIVAQARAMIDAGDDANHEVFYLAEDLLKRARALDDGDGEVWAAQAQVSWFLFWMAYDRSSARRELVRTQAERAVKLAPDSPEAQIAYAGHLIASDASMPDGIKALEELARRVPTDRRVFRMLAHCYSMTDRLDEAVATFDRAHAIPGGDPIALVNKSIQLFWHGRYAEAEQAVAQSLALKVTGRGQMTDVLLKLCWRGDLEGAAAALERWPAWLRLEDRGVFLASQVWLWRREPDKAVTALNAVTRDVFNDSFYVGPRATFLALAHEQAGRADAARAEWENVLKVADRFLASDPSAKSVLASKACALIRLGRATEATSIVRELEQINELRTRVWSCDAPAALLRIALGRADEVVKKFDTDRRTAFMSRTPPAPRAALRHNPVFDPIRATPEFQRWMESAPAPEEKKETKPAPAGPGPALSEKPAPAEKSLVVLPLGNLSPDPENAFFTDGMHAQLITTLQRMTDLRVFGRDTALAFKRGSMTVAEFAQRLGAANVLTGSVHRAGTKARIVLELRRASDDALLWQSPDTARDLSDTWAVQAEVAEQVARALKARESVGSNAHARFLTKNPQAFDLFVKADQLFFSGEFARAIPLYTESYALDSGYVAPAYMLAHAHCNLLFESVDPAARQRDAAEARRWIEVVTRLDPTGFGAIAEAHYLSNVEEDNLRALEQAERGMRAIPNDTAAPTFHAVALEGLGRLAEALESYHRATQIDPLLLFSLSNEARVLTLLRRESEAVAMLVRMADAIGADQSPDSAPHRQIAQQFFRLRGTLPPAIERISSPQERAWWLLRARRFDEAERAAAEAAKQNGIIDVVRFEIIALWHDALLRLNRRADAESAASELLQLARKLHATIEVGPPRKAGWLAVAEARAGHADAAISAARRFVEDAAPGRQQAIRWQREIAFAELYAFLNRPRECCELLAKLLRAPTGLTVPMLKVDPKWDNVRDDPAFKALLADPKNSAPL